MKRARCAFLVMVMSLSAGAGFAENLSDVPVPAGTGGDAALSTAGYEQRVRQLENEHGVYHPQLGEALLSLGLAYRAQNKYPQAMAAIERALQIQRVNTGLYDLGQTRIVELIIECASAYRDWDKVGDRLHYLLWVYRRNYQDNKKILLPELEKVEQFIFDVYRSGMDNMPLNSLVEADDVNSEAIAILEDLKQSEEERINALYRTAVINYHIADAVTSPRVSHREIRAAMLESNRPIPYVDELEVRDYFFLQSFFKGKRAIDEVIDIYKKELPGSAAKYAEALVFLGDWYLVFDQKRNAMPRYEDAYAVLVENHIPELKIKALLGEPKPLKTLLFPGEKIQAAGPDTLYVDAVLDVPGNGWPTNIKIIKTNPANEEKLRRRGKLAIAGVRYRPRFENGKPVDTKNVTFQYVFDIQDANGVYLEQGGENAFFLKDVIDK